MNQYPIASRVLHTLHPLEQEVTLDKNKNYLFDLSYLGLLNINGAKALEFLQGQLTCDVTKVSETHMIQGTQCNLQGRVQAFLDVINCEGVKLVLAQDMLEATSKSFSKPALLSKVTMEQNQQYQVLGFYLQNKQDLMPQNSMPPEEVYALHNTPNHCCYHLGNGFYIYLVPNNLLDQFTHSFTERNQFYGSLSWHALRLSQGHVSIYPETRGLFLPHRLGLHLTQMISFDKGCYKGQEIIARLHYRSTIKHELKTQIIETNEKLVLGQEITKGTGELVDYSYLGGNRYLVARCVLK